jgi:hypothetical protein
MKSSKVKDSDTKYQGRSGVASGSNYGIGEAPKVGTLRSSYMSQIPKTTKKISKPPRSVR